ncbi:MULTISPECIES: OsmC family protein [Runella]|uniref:Osmotically inducible protein OsmC n=1 Tax=Runella defluvii TaxID=370973 RepID=A0A7W6ER18_9BACT|nr:MULTISPECIES: OsmC family protein [Runella]MBB3839219.1 osmotically inducible protein OsmC [Runella defluvii]MCA0228811.1 OsmC family protein [Bacteroidota bacterium]HAK77544.1 OsmC family peroxiredoxin [Runella sp.]HAO51310.1 OsmC family peroxiredoxin [Runella sp.]
MKRTAAANWQGSGKEGHGTVSTQSTVLDGTQYSFNTRFADGIGTNPEELVGAAHAGCFTMKLSFVIGEYGLTAENIDTKATVTFENGAIPNIHLSVKASVPGMTAEQFAEAAQNAKANCPISKLLNTDITMDAELV